ncbi:MAG: DUF5615 family PIN-like protein [Acidimicrobiia bacterium]|nr:DUF5615 family PIN-like protein [Acidimicrobiia bacterium]
MRFLVDANLSPLVAAALNAAGHDAVHVFERDLGEATDQTVLEAARVDDRVIISTDTDFGALLARHRHDKPSFILLRHVNGLSPDQHARLLLANLDAIAEELNAGAVITFSRSRIRVRRLPIVRET